MSADTVTIPGRAVVIRTSTPPTEGAKVTSYTSHTMAEQFEQLKHLLSERPLRPPVRGKKA